MLLVSRTASSGSATTRSTSASRPPTSSRPSSASSPTPRIPSRTRRSALLAAGLLAAARRGLRRKRGRGRRQDADRRRAARSWRRSSPSGPSDYQQRAGVTVTYGAIGSGGGIAQITARTVDFGASDAPLTPDQADSCKGCLQVPWALAATLVVVQRQGRAERAEALRAGAREHLPRQDHALERPGDRAPQPGRASCRPRDHARLSEAMEAATPTRSATTSPRSARSGRARKASRPR